MGKQQKVLLTMEEKIATITLNRPEKRNALNYEVWKGIEDALHQIEKDKTANVVILKGEGKTFCAGLDLSWENPLAEYLQIEKPTVALKKFQELIKSVQKIYNQIENLLVPVICMIQGAAIGGGLELALACDLRMASEDSFFSIPEIKLGLIPDLGGTQRLPRIVGMAKAKELIYTGKRISAPQAKAIGLVNEIYKIDELETEVLNLAKEIANSAPLAMANAKRAINKSKDVNFEVGLEYEAFLNSQCLISNDVKEGILSYIQKRTPEFKGE